MIRLPNVSEKFFDCFEDSKEICLLQRANRSLRDTLFQDLPVLSVRADILYRLLQQGKKFPILRELNILPAPSCLRTRKGKLLVKDETLPHNNIILLVSQFPRLQVARSSEHFLRFLQIEKSICITRLELQCGGYLQSVTFSHQHLIHLECKLNNTAPNESLFFLLLFFVFCSLCS